MDELEDFILFEADNSFIHSWFNRNGPLNPLIQCCILVTCELIVYIFYLFHLFDFKFILLKFTNRINVSKI